MLRYSILRRFSLVSSAEWYLSTNLPPVDNSKGWINRNRYFFFDSAICRNSPYTTQLGNRIPEARIGDFSGTLPPQRSARKDDCLSAKRESRLCSEARRRRVEKCPARVGIHFQRSPTPCPIPWGYSFPVSSMKTIRAASLSGTPP